MRKNSKDITPRNKKNQKHGLWEWYYHNGNLMCKRLYHNGKEVGYSEWYLYDEILSQNRYSI